MKNESIATITINKEFFSTEETASILNVKPITIRRYVKAGKIKATRPTGKRLYFKKADVLAFIGGDNGNR